MPHALLSQISVIPRADTAQKPVIAVDPDLAGVPANEDGLVGIQDTPTSVRPPSYRYDWRP